MAAAVQTPDELQARVDSWNKTSVTLIGVTTVIAVAVAYFEGLPLLAFLAFAAGCFLLYVNYQQKIIQEDAIAAARQYMEQRDDLQGQVDALYAAFPGRGSTVAEVIASIQGSITALTPPRRSRVSRELRRVQREDAAQRAAVNALFQ